MTILVDSFGRRIEYLRVTVTELAAEAAGHLSA